MSRSLEKALAARSPQDAVADEEAALILTMLRMTVRRHLSNPSIEDDLARRLRASYARLSFTGLTEHFFVAAQEADA